ncbi:hypothetical protein HMPREF9996_00169 [Aggregatibacter actinomycetemcomitans Y4]|nr:hypothetical protein HMPREF9996_00169 [Aggregatibacter actinomycetemcomitans Y4]
MPFCLVKNAPNLIWIQFPERKCSQHIWRFLPARKELSNVIGLMSEHLALLSSSFT